ncbi:MAG TPA: hypothetical protein VNA14_05060 [Mycobacteriales bacterium]|nr:hypothetical protein [Mycobacteriales bacterium]
MTTTSDMHAVDVDRDPLLCGLTLHDLRDYRRALGQEESRVSYWRRILQGRLDILRGEGSAADIDNLGAMLSDDRVCRGRTALIEIVPADDIPPLPNLAQLWERTTTSTDPGVRAVVLVELAEAEAQLSSYRSALHRRLGLATGELIARYREHPGLCLDVLPTEPVRSASTG